MIDLQKILGFTKLLHKLRRVERTVRSNGEERWENDTEHSYHLAMLAWYIIDNYQLNLNKELAIKYALAHDLVEAYAGDTYIFSDDNKHKESKQQREEEAAKILTTEFPEFPEIHNLIREYEKKENKESRFITALDKLEPMLSIFLDNGKTWKEKGITLEMIIENKKEKMALSPEIEACFYEFVEILRKEKDRLF